MRRRWKNRRMGRWRLSWLSRARIKVMCRLNMPSMIRTQEEIVTWLNFPSNIV